MLREIFQSISRITDQTSWGEYAFSRDILKDCIDEREKSEMIHQAVRCGKDYAKLIMSEFEGCSVQKIMQAVNIKLVKREDSIDSIVGERILFAQYTPPDEVMIMEEPLKRYGKTIIEAGLERYLPSADEVYQLLLGHELFHWVEEKYQDTIYTRNRKVTLWKLWKFKNQSTVRALGELAAMIFSQSLNRVTYSPFVLDVLLFYSYNKEAAHRIYIDMMKVVEK